LAFRLEAVKKIIPYIKLVLTQKLRVLDKTEEAYHGFFNSDEFNRLFKELIADKLAISQITSLLGEKPHSTGEIADSLGLSPSEIAQYMVGSSRQGLVRYDINSKCYSLA
jgi:F420-non-reducing hydrogenase iron-sulfur subunit